jgi:hypothetical protein
VNNKNISLDGINSNDKNKIDRIYDIDYEKYFAHLSKYNDTNRLLKNHYNYAVSSL